MLPGLRLDLRRPHAPHVVQIAACEDDGDLSAFVQQLRAVKAALRAGLRAEAGKVSEDALAVVDGLQGVNPAAPDPSADTDLWTGDWLLLTAQAGTQCTVQISADPTGERSATAHRAEVRSLIDGHPALRLHAEGVLSPARPDALAFRVVSVSLAPEGGDDSAGGLDACEALLREWLPQAGLERTAGAAVPTWSATAAGTDSLAEFELGQLYLDQDLHILRDGGSGELLILEASAA